jgi:hypothetical protein
MGYANDFEITEEERLDILHVRQWCKAAHVQDTDALSAFNDGRGVFDVTPHAVKLETFIAQNAISEIVQRTTDGLLPWINALVNNRRLHFAFKKR